MKFLVTLSLAAFTSVAFAQSDLSNMKEDANAHIDRKISNLQEAKSCINDASTTDAFKACKYDMHKDMKRMKMEKMEEKLEKQEDKLSE
jgi:hypothetical protein